MRINIIALAGYAALLSACSSVSDGSGPRGWKHYMDGLWFNPRAGEERQEFTAVRSPFEGTLKEYSSWIRAKILSENEAKYVGGAPFERCPGEAGLQTYRLGKSGSKLARVAFAVRSGRSMLTEYIRPTNDRDDPAAIEALAANVCAAL